MGFTDEDLKRLKESKFLPGWEDGVDMDALLARLEAAERMCEYIGKVPDLKNMDWFINGDKLFQAWRKACGK